MAENSAIEWCHHTFNPWIGCQKVGPACNHCYAEALATVRLGVAWGPGAPRRRTARSTWLQPLRWNRRTAAQGIRYRVFCASLADVFDNAVDPEWRRDLAALIGQTPHLDWLLLTKRIGNAARMLDLMFGRPTPPTNVWLGATIANQEEADRDVPKLLATPAPVRFLSMEPLLGPARLNNLRTPHPAYAGVTAELDALAGEMFDHGQASLARSAQVDWVIVGGESGPGARPMHPDWARSLRDQCTAAGVPFLFKQWGEWAPICAIESSEAMDAALYYPRRRIHLPEGPRRCRVEQCVLQASGRRFDVDCWSRTLGEDPAAGDFAYRSHARAMAMMRMGKKAAGRLLDGMQHDGMPA